MSLRLQRYEESLLSVFRASPSKREAHRRSAPIIADMIADRALLTEWLTDFVVDAANLNRRHYPVVALDGPLNAHFGLVVNCWIPLPDRRTDISTKAIHHHGNMLLTTGTLLGPGYLHWTFTRPEEIDAGKDLFRINVDEREQHGAGHVAFVDRDIPHLPWYPADLSITLCLWSNSLPTTWRDHVKRIPILKQNEARLRALASAVGLDRMISRALDVKLIEYFDYYPVADGFRGMRERDEHKRGPNADHLQSCLYILQKTGHESLGRVVAEHLARGRLSSPERARDLLRDLETGRLIEPKLSDCHLNLPHTFFTPRDVERSVAALAQHERRAEPA